MLKNHIISGFKKTNRCFYNFNGNIYILTKANTWSEKTEHKTLLEKQYKTPGKIEEVVTIDKNKQIHETTNFEELLTFHENDNQTIKYRKKKIKKINNKIVNKKPKNNKFWKSLDIIFDIYDDYTNEYNPDNDYYDSIYYPDEYDEYEYDLDIDYENYYDYDSDYIYD